MRDEKASRTRDPYWDIVRGIAILLVILGHSIFATRGARDPGHEFIYSFHMPLFMVVAGYYFRPALEKYDTWTLIRRRFIQLILPVLVLGSVDFFFFGTIHENLRYLPAEPLQSNLMHWYGTLIRTLWFLPALFGCSMVALAADRIFRGSPWFYLALIVATMFLPDVMESKGFQAMLPCFTFGLFLRQEGWEGLYERHPALVTALSCLLFALLLIPFRYEMTFHECGSWLFSGDASPLTLLWFFVLRTVTGIAGSIALLCAVRTIRNQTPAAAPWRFLSHIGQHTLSLYIISYYLWIFWLNRYGTESGSWWTPLALAAGIFLLSWPLSLGTDRLKSRNRQRT